MLIWGSISAAQSGLHNFGGLVGTRFILGFAEAPYFPGYESAVSPSNSDGLTFFSAIFLLSTWYKRDELAKRFACFYAGPALSNMFGGLIAAGVLKNLDGAHGIAAWRWLFIIESVVTVVFALISL